MNRAIDLNVDIGEGFPFDRELLRFATSANVCCGIHAGGAELTVETVALCRENGVRVGAHPGYPDRATMGRAPLEPKHEREYLTSVFDQVRLFWRNFQPDYIKPHGAYYNDLAVVLPLNWEFLSNEIRHPSRYEAGGAYLSKIPGLQSLTLMLRMFDLALVGFPGTAHEQAASRAGRRFVREGFADRAYLESGLLKPRSEPGAVLTDFGDVRTQTLRLAAEVDTICLHGDGPDCVAFAELVHRTLTEAGYEVRAWV